MADQQPYLGTALKFPTTINQLGRVDVVGGVGAVEQSILIILNTPLGSDFAREHFGSQIRLALFEPNNQIAQTLLDYYINEAIFKWEKRIRLVDIQYSYSPDEPSAIICTIVYRLKQASEIHSFVFPFYRELNN